MIYPHKPNGNDDTNDKRIRHRIHLVPFSGQESHLATDATDDSQRRQVQDTSWPELLSRDIDQRSTQADIKAISKLPPPSALVNDGLIDKQTTWLIPVAQDVKAGSNLEDQEADTQNYVAVVRKLVKSSGVYALASIASPLVSLVLAPFLTRSLSHMDYGAFAVLNTIIALAAGITQLGLSSAFFRAYNYDYETRKDRLGIFSTVVMLLVLSSVPSTVIAMVLASSLSIALFNSPSFADSIRLTALVVLLQNLTVPGFAWLRAESRAGFFSLLSITNLVVVLGAAIVLVGILHMGIAGALLATAGGYTFVAICTLPAILVRAGLRFRFDIAWNLLSFGVPLVFHFVSYWVLQLSDRYLLSRLGSLAQVASYAVAYSLGGVLSVVIISPFILAWPSAMFAIAKRADAAQAFRLVFRWFSFGLLLAAFAFSLASTTALDLLFPPAYYSAAPIIPIITTSIMFYGVYNVFAIGVGIQRKTWLSAIFTAISAVVNVGLNLVLIPLYGSMGAAVSTLIAYALLALISYIVNQRIYPIPFEVGRFGLALVVGVALYIGSSFLARTQGTYGTFVVYIGTLCLYSGCLVLLGKLPAWSHTSTNQQEIHVV